MTANGLLEPTEPLGRQDLQVACPRCGRHPHLLSRPWYTQDATTLALQHSAQRGVELSMPQSRTRGGGGDRKWRGRARAAPLA